MPAPTLSRRHSLALLAMLPAAALALPGLANPARPHDWAEPVTLAGVPNLFRVAPHLMRSAQPSRQGFLALPGLGIKTVINLRRRVDGAALAQGSGLATLHIKIKTRNITENDGEAIVRALRALRAALRHGGVLVHCTHGADRTGLIVALWRMLDQNWTRDAAIAEMTGGGYGFHPVWINIPHYLHSVDVAALRSRVDQA